METTYHPRRPASRLEWLLARLLPGSLRSPEQVDLIQCVDLAIIEDLNG